MNQNKINKLYAICKHKDTKEYHVFHTHINKDKKCCFSSNISLCGAMQTSDSEFCIITCVTEIQIREKAAEVGNTICGNCMKSIFKTIL